MSPGAVFCEEVTTSSGKRETRVVWIQLWTTTTSMVLRIAMKHVGVDMGLIGVDMDLKIVMYNDLMLVERCCQ